MSGKRGRRRGEHDADGPPPEGGVDGMAGDGAGQSTPAGPAPWDEPEGAGGARDAGTNDRTQEVAPAQWKPAQAKPRWQAPVGPQGRGTAPGRSGPDSDKDALISMLGTGPAEPPPDALDQIRASPGEVPSFHSDVPLYAMWIALGVALLVGAAVGVWAVFLRQPF